MEELCCQGCRERSGEIAELKREVAKLRAQVAELTSRTRQNSQNSSRPPSTDGPNIKRRPPQTPSGRSPGAQPGHERHERPPLPPDQIEICKPTECRNCGHPLTGEDSNPLRHQVLELPEIKPQVTEYQLHRLTCPDCGTSTCGQLPKGVPTGRQGPRLQSFLALLSGGYRLSKRLIESLCEDVLGIPICPGTICNLEEQTTAATEPVVEELREHVRRQPANMDETGWRENNQRGWLWVVATQMVTVFHICRSRGSDVVRELLGPELHWVLTSDRFSAYNWLPLRYRQICWAHLRRDFQAMIDRAGPGKTIGEELLDFSDNVFHNWYRVRDGTWKRCSMLHYINGVRPWFRTLLEEGSTCGCAKTAAVCRDLLRLETSLWAFLRVDGVEPTNNAAERALRHAVLWRKLSHGTHSAGGSRYVSNILSILATCRQQRRNGLEFLTACCHARLHGGPTPSLLPAR